MSYGMMFCVQLNRRAEFDRLWRWALTHMYMTEGENAGYFAWSCRPDGQKNAWGPAPDDEEYFAMALFFAAHRWGSGAGAQAALAARSAEADSWVRRLWETPLRTGPRRYYDNCLYLFALLALGGQYRIWMPRGGAQ